MHPYRLTERQYIYESILISQKTELISIIAQTIRNGMPSEKTFLFHTLLVCLQDINSDCSITQRRKQEDMQILIGSKLEKMYTTRFILDRSKSLR